MMNVKDRANELLAQWAAEEKAIEERNARYAEYVDYMVNVERIRPEALPCVHGTAMWPDRGQVCGACEYEAEDHAAAAEMSDADLYAAAVAQAEREAQRAAEIAAMPDPWGGAPAPF